VPRLIESRQCPHCGAKLPEPKPRICPSCAGSLQKRHLRVGCLSSAPKLVVIGAALWCLVEQWA